VRQCVVFTGTIPVFDVFLIKIEWYWYVVWQSGMGAILIKILAKPSRKTDALSFQRQAKGLSERVGRACGLATRSRTDHPSPTAKMSSTSSR
jgi:hypothetical protein